MSALSVLIVVEGLNRVKYIGRPQRSGGTRKSYNLLNESQSKILPFRGRCIQ